MILSDVLTYILILPMALQVIVIQRTITLFKGQCKQFLEKWQNHTN